MNRITIFLGLQCSISYVANARGIAIDAEMAFGDRKIPGLKRFTLRGDGALSVAEVEFDSRTPPPDALVRYLAEMRVRVLTFKFAPGYLRQRKGDVTYEVAILGKSEQLAGPDSVEEPKYVADMPGAKAAIKHVPLNECGTCGPLFGVPPKPVDADYDPIEG
jgi:hypothetical protein